MSPLIALGGVDYSMGTGWMLVRALRCAGLGSMYVPRTDTSIVESRPFLGNILTSDPVRYARNAAILEAEPALALGAPTVAWCNAAFRSMRALREPSYPARIRQPMLIVAGGNDQVVSNSAIEDFAGVLRAGSHLVIVGAQHELLMEQDRFRSPGRHGRRQARNRRSNRRHSATAAPPARPVESICGRQTSSIADWWCTARRPALRRRRVREALDRRRGRDSARRGHRRKN